MDWKRSLAAATLAITVGVSALAAGPTALAQEATPSADCPVTTPEENAALAENYWLEVYNGRSPEKVSEYLAEGFVRNNLARTHENAPGFEDDEARVVENLADFSDLELTVDEAIASDDAVAVRLTWTGTHSDPIAPWNAPVSDESMTITVMAFYRVECGKLAEQWITFDYLSMMQQLGIITDAELSSLGDSTSGDTASGHDATPAAGEDEDDN